MVRAAASAVAVPAARDDGDDGDDAPFTSTTLCKGLIMGALVAQSAGTSLLARRTYELYSYDGAVAGLLQEALKLPAALLWLTVVARAPVRRQRALRGCRAARLTLLNGIFSWGAIMPSPARHRKCRVGRSVVATANPLARSSLQAGTS